MAISLQTFDLRMWLAATAILGAAALVAPSAQAAALQTARSAAHQSQQTMTDISARRSRRHRRPQVYYRPYDRPSYVGPGYYARPGFYYRPYGYYYGGPGYYGWSRGVGIGFGF